VASERRSAAAERPPRARATAGPSPSRASEPRHEPLRSPAPLPRSPATAAPDAPEGRRTITITGRGDDRQTGRAELAARPRAQRRAHERPGYRPDRLALYAVLLGVVLILVAATSSHAATLRLAHVQPSVRVSAAAKAPAPSRTIPRR
jgi:hypothetical protein